jgi:hypothetical protein
MLALFDFYASGLPIGIRIASQVWMEGKRIPENWYWAIGTEELPEDRCSCFSVEIWKCNLISNPFENLVSRSPNDRAACKGYSRDPTTFVARSFTDQENIVAVFQQVVKK